MNKRILFPILFTFVMFSIAFAGQITDSPREIVFYEDNNELRMGNGVIGIVAYKNKGLEQAKPTYFDSLEFTESKANEEIYLEELANSGWRKVNFAHYSVSMNEEEHTITKHYWNNIQESLDITYYLAEFDSPTKLSFKLWGFFGTYRIQWRVSEINTEQIIANGFENYYVDEATEQEPMSSIPITIDPPEPTIPEDFELKINYDDLIEAVGNEKVYVENEYNEDGTIQATTFILGDFSMQFWETLELDPQVTSGHTTNQEVNSIWKDSSNRYWITVQGDWESGADDGGYALMTTNFSNASSWALAVEFPNGAGDQNFLFEDNTNMLHFVWHDDYDLEEKNSSDGTTWSSESTVILNYGAFQNTRKEPQWVIDNNNMILFGTFSSADVHRVIRYNSTADTFTESGNLETSTRTTDAMYFDDDNNLSYWVITASSPYTNVYQRTSGNSFSSSSSTTINAPSGKYLLDAQILEFNDDLYLFARNLTGTERLFYYVCNSTERASGCTDTEWDESNPNTVPNSDMSSLFDGTKGIDNEGIFIFPYNPTSYDTTYYIFTNNTWFKLNDLGLSLNQSSSAWYSLKTLYEPSTSKLLMAYSDDIAGYLEAFTYEYELPDLAIQLVNQDGDIITTNQTLNVYCDGSTLIKTTNTSTGSIVVYPADYSGCSTNSTTIQLTQNDYQETNLTITRDSNLDGYNLTANAVGWNITLNAGGCTNTTIPTAIGNASYSFNLNATNGTHSITKYGQIFNPNIIYSVVDIDLQGSINMTIYPNTTTPTIYDNKTIVTSRPTSSLLQINEDMWITDRFRARDRRASAQMTDFFMYATNGSYSLTLNDSSTGWINTTVNNLPLGNTNLTFQKNGYNNSYNTTILNCSYIFLNQSMEKAGLELRVFDESTLSALTFNVTIANSTESVTFTGQTNPMFKNYTEIPNGDITITLKNASGGYEQRNYVEYMSSTTFLNLSAYLLNNNEGLIRNFHVVDSAQSPLANAIVKIYKFIGSSWTLVSSKYTDDSGTASFLMNPSETYQVVALYYQGVSWISSETYTVVPSLSDYTITIGITVGGGYNNIFETVAYRIQPSGFSLPRTNSTTINYTVSCTSSDLEWFGFTLLGILPDGNNTTIYTGNSTNASGGLLIADIDTTNLTKVYGTFYIQRNGFSLYQTTKNFIVYDYGYGNYSFFAFLLNTKNDTTIPDSAKNIVALFVAIGIMAGLMMIGVGAFGSAIVGMSFLTILSLFHWFNIPAMIVMWFILIGYLVFMRGYG